MVVGKQSGRKRTKTGSNRPITELINPGEFKGDGTHTTRTTVVSHFRDYLIYIKYGKTYEELLADDIDTKQHVRRWPGRRKKKKTSMNEV
jgi:hypothetical protein